MDIIGCVHPMELSRCCWCVRCDRICYRTPLFHFVFCVCSVCCLLSNRFVSVHLDSLRGLPILQTLSIVLSSAIGRLFPPTRVTCT
jgi:hypothetical protein